MVSNFVFYSPQLDKFLKLKKYKEVDLRKFIAKIKSKSFKGKFTIATYMHLVVVEFVQDAKEILKQEEGNCVEALFEAVVEVYPLFQIDSVCQAINAIIEEELDEKEVDKNEVIPFLSLSDLKKLEKKVTGCIIGQNEAIREVFDGLKILHAGFDSFLTFYFSGPTGVGKTELAKVLAEKYLGTSKRFLKINCGEYSNPHEYAKLIGSPPGYVGFNEKGILSERAAKSSRWIILFDEIEKASNKLHNLLLGFLDDGKIQDNHGTELDFSNSIVIFTSNVGIWEHVGKKQVGFDAEVTTYDSSKEQIVDSLKGQFPPEFLNRIDSLIHFNQLTKENIRGIIKLNLKQLPIRSTKKLVDYIVDNSYSLEYGAREVRRFIKREVTSKIASCKLSSTRYSKFKSLFKDGELFIEGDE
jgi:ATP-dependent Clp protease ATP-binding subunit ClpA